MQIKRRWPCPHCGRMYYIRENSPDEWDIVECCQIAGFALRHCPRCGWVQRIEPREDEEVKAIRERYGRRPGTAPREEEDHAGETDRNL